MSTINLPTITMRELPKFIRGVAEIHNTSDLESGFMKTISNLMLNLIAVRFATGKDPQGRLWKSPSTSTRLGGRFSSAYKIRPSGSNVTGSSKRLTDTGQLLSSYKVLHQSAKKVVVGPTGNRNVLIAEVAAEDWNNQITGWSKKDSALAVKEYTSYFERKARELK